MIDLERQPEVLLEPDCDSSQIRCLGVSLGSPSTAIARDRIIEVTFSPLVRGLMLDAGRPHEYTGFDGQPVSLELARTSVVYGSGVLHSDLDASFSVLSGKVSKLSLYGAWLSRFAQLNTLQKLLQRAGKPDRCLRIEAHGDLIGFDCYYANSRKWLRWLDASSRPSVVVFGGDAEMLSVGRWGGVSRTSQSV